ncbi:GMC family oxidoreductase [Skermania sp. ID1734]|uniref:FAD-dependent oxidoreductase n=1 Tax=Skermania sp. ID1734 TaxID=2597516 RepID=UPI00117ED810|nr:GMC family oxidoreductase [Skermania sp. ID1734]TSD96579.1 GMC family oxidoreductase [Skermania sp. ID1734]
MNEHSYDYDWIVVGSGFGGSVAALRLAEKGYRVAVLERGRRFADDDFAKTTWQLGRYYWMPKLGLKGVLGLTMFRDVFVASGCGVGGGSLGYANTLYRARPAFYRDPQWADLADWETELDAHYDTAEHMLGVTEYDEDSPAGELLREYATEHGFGDTYARTRVGVFLGEPGVAVPDPYFGGAGPQRTGCVRCGSCMVGCRYGAKNTLVKNYLYFAEQRGVDIIAERTVEDVRPLSGGDGSEGYAVTHIRSGAWARTGRQRLTARGVVVAAGALGTNRLLFRCKLAGSLPRVSDRLGELVRTNSESILAVTGPAGGPDFSRGIAITASVYPDPDTHIEPVTYGGGADSQSLLFWLLTEAGGRGTQPMHLALNMLRHPARAASAARIRNWSRRTVILLVMQSLDGAMRLKVKHRLPNGSVVLTTEQDPNNPNPDKIPAAYRAAEWLQANLGGTSQAVFTEALLSIPTTAHILGGVAIGADETKGVVDDAHRVFGYQNLLVCDGSAVPANIGVNPGLTITAMAERALTHVPPKLGAAAADGDSAASNKQRKVRNGNRRARSTK